MNKTWLVARREYLENLRTKTFWIGILAFPIILTVSLVVPRLLEGAKDVREYAVIDRSDRPGWLMGQVDERSAFPDLEKVFLELRKAWKKDGAAGVEEFPEFMRPLAEKLAEFEKDQVIQAARGLSSMAEVASGDGVGLPEGLREGVRATADRFREWYRNLSTDEAKTRFGTGLSKSRYRRVDAPDDEAELARRVREGELFAYFVLEGDPVNPTEGNKYVSENLTDDDLKDWFTRHANEAIREQRFQEKRIDASTMREILKPFRFTAKQIGDEGEEDVADQDTARQFVPVAFVYLLWLAVFSISQMLLTNTIEEKSNRIIEVLLSSVSPLQLMIGKILGIAATGLTVVTSWIVFFYIGIKFGPRLFGFEPPFDLTFLLTDPVYLASFIAYFFLGYLLYAAFLVGIGSVCNSLKEAQNLMTPVTLLLIVPLLAMIPVVQDPNGALAKLLSYIPLFTPFVMMNRAGGPPATSEYVITTILLIAAIVVSMWAAAKVFRVGILMTGKPPKIREMLRWLRSPSGVAVPRKD